MSEKKSACVEEVRRVRDNECMNQCEGGGAVCPKTASGQQTWTAKGKATMSTGLVKTVRVIGIADHSGLCTQSEPSSRYVWVSDLISRVQILLATEKIK